MKNSLLIFLILMTIGMCSPFCSSAENCYDLGYRFGLCSTKSLQGIPCKPENDIIIPEECRGRSDTESGIRDGVKAVYDTLNPSQLPKTGTSRNSGANIGSPSTQRKISDLLLKEGIKIGMTCDEAVTLYRFQRNAYGNIYAEDKTTAFDFGYCGKGHLSALCKVVSRSQGHADFKALTSAFIQRYGAPYETVTFKEFCYEEKELWYKIIQNDKYYKFTVGFIYNNRRHGNKLLRNTSLIKYCLYDITDEIEKTVRGIENNRNATDKLMDAF